MNDVTQEINASYSEADKAALERVRAWLNKEAGRDQATLGRLSGVKAGTLSQVLSGQYPSSPSDWLATLADVVDRYWERQKAGLSKIPLTETKTFSMMTRVIARAHQDGDFGVIFGRVGIGKTMVVQRYAATRAAVLVEGFDGIDHSTLVGELVEGTGAKVSPSATQSAKINAVIKRLKGSDKVILVDEAQWLPDRSLGALRRISDMAGVGVVLVGNPELEIRVADPDGRFGQITSRIGFWPPVFTEVPRPELEQMARAFLDRAGVEAGDESVSQFAESAKGSVRLLEKLLRNALRNALTRRKPITGELVRQVYAETFRGV
jgi:DNA transposition AAA+ family ATPase